MAHHGAAALAEQQIFFRETAAERARHLRKLAARVREGSDTSDVREDIETVRKNVKRAMKEEAPRIRQQSLQMLGGLLTADEGLAGAPFELLRQSAVLCWSALEVLASDCFAKLLNKCPKLSVKLTEDESARKLFTVKSLSLDMIAEYGFDMSDRMGDFFLQQSPIDSVVRMKTVFGALFPEAETLRRSLDEHIVWMLYHRRNLIVHRRSVVDQYYLAKTGDSLQLGSRLVISPPDLKSYVASVGSVGCQIITAADDCFKRLASASG